MKSSSKMLLCSVFGIIGLGSATFVGCSSLNTPIETTVKKEEPKKVIEKIEKTVVIKKIHPYDNKKYHTTFVCLKSKNEIRNQDFGKGKKHQIQIWTHNGGSVLEEDMMRETIQAVTEKFNIFKSTPEFIDLIYETMVTETYLGKEKWEVGIKKWKNYGIGQFRTDSAKDLMKWLKYVRPDQYEVLYSFYNKKENLKWNLTYNIPFSIAMIGVYYWNRIPDIHSNIKTVVDRGKCWKSEYNTHLGLGTVNCYVKRVKSMKKLQEKKRIIKEAMLNQEENNVIHYFTMKSYSHRRKLNKLLKEIDHK